MSDARSRARSLRGRDAKPAAADTAGDETAETPRRPAGTPGKRVRQTVDLDDQRHRDLAAWRMETALNLGRTRVTTQDVLESAVEAILTDPTVARRVRETVGRVLDERDQPPA